MMAILGDLVTISSSSEKLKCDTFWLLNLDMVEQQTGNIIEYNYVSKDRLNGSIIQFDSDVVLYSKLRPNLNKVVLPEQAGFATSEMLPLRPDSSKLLREYLAVYLRSDSFVTWAVSKTAGAKMPRLGTKELLGKELSLPSLCEQRKIVSEFQKINKVIFIRKQQLSKLDELVKSRFIELFDATSAEKCTRKIKDYADVLGGYAFKSELFCADAVPVIRISNINNGKVELDYTVCFDETFWDENKRFRAEQGDILMAMSGATTGKAGIYKEDTPALINQRVACIRTKDNIACPMFLFVATQLEWMYDLIQETSAGCAQPNISGKQIENMPVPNATYEQQQQFAAFVEQVDKSKLAIQKSLDQLETLKKSLMQKYFG